MSKWYFLLNGEKIGPVNEETLKDKISSGKIKDDSHLLKKGWSCWIPAHQTDIYKKTFGLSETSAVKDSAEGVAPIVMPLTGKLPLKEALIFRWHTIKSKMGFPTSFFRQTLWKKGFSAPTEPVKEHKASDFEGKQSEPKVEASSEARPRPKPAQIPEEEPEDDESASEPSPEPDLETEEMPEYSEEDLSELSIDDLTIEEDLELTIIDDEEQEQPDESESEEPQEPKKPLKFQFSKDTDKKPDEDTD